MKVSIDVPQPLVLHQKDSLELYLPDSSGAVITVHGDGIVHWSGNGGGAPTFAVNLAELARQVRAELR